MIFDHFELSFNALNPWNINKKNFIINSNTVYHHNQLISKPIHNIKNVDKE